MSSEGPGGVTLGFDLDAGPIVSSIDRVGSSSERAASSADKLAAAGERMGASLRSAAAGQEALVRDTLKLNALLNQAEKIAETANTIDLANKRAVTSMVTEISAVRALSAEMGGLARVEELTAQAMATLDARQRAVALSALGVSTATKAAAAETAAAGAAAAGAGSSAGLLERALGAITGVATGAGSGIAGLAGSLASMVIGGFLISGVVAGIGLVVAWWDKLGEAARKAKEEHQEAIKALEDFAKKKELGPAGQIGAGSRAGRADVDKDLAEIDRLQKQIAVLRGGTSSGEAAELEQAELARLEGRLNATRLHYRTLLHDVDLGEREARRLVKESNDNQQRDEAAALARRLDFNQQDAAARRSALALLAKDREEYARLLKLPNTPDNSKEIARVASEMKQLDEALNPKAHRGRKEDTGPSRELAAAIREAERAVAEFNKAREQQTEFSAKSIETARLDVDATRRMVEAYREGPAAVRALTDQLEIEAATRDFLAKTTALDADERQRGLALLQAEIRERQQLGHVLADEKEARDQAAAAAKRSAEEAIRDAERRARQFGRTVSTAISGALDELGQKGANFFQTWWDAGKRGLNRFIGDAVGQLAEQKFAEAFGVGASGAAAKQVAAGAVMLQAAQLQVAAANTMLGANSVGGVGGAGAAGAGSVALHGASAFAIAGSIGLAGAAGALTGYNAASGLYSQSHGAFGNYARGAIGGAAGGALGGAAIGAGIGALGGPITAVGGAVVGAAAGLIGGLLGIHNASKEAAKATAELRKELELNMASLRATVSHDDLGQSIAQVNAQREQLRKQIEDAYAGGGANSDTVRERNRQLAEMNALEDRYIAQLEEEAAAKSRYFTEDLDVRALRARGQDKAADDLAFRHQQDRELDDYRRTHDMTKAENQQQYAYLQQVLALEAQKRATDANTAALNALTTSVNTVTGFKLADALPYVQEFSAGRPYPGTTALNPLPLPTNPFLPPTSPLTPTMPALSQSSTGTVATAPLQITIAPGAIVVNESKTPELTATAVTRMVLTKIDEERNARDGLSGSRGAALERLKLPPGGTPWRS